MNRDNIYEQFKNEFQHIYCENIESILNKVASMLINNCRSIEILVW